MKSANEIIRAALYWVETDRTFWQDTAHVDRATAEPRSYRLGYVDALNDLLDRIEREQVHAPLYDDGEDETE